MLAAQGDVAQALAVLDQVLAEELELPMPLESARTLIVKGQLERRRKQKRAASESLGRALELCEAMGATLWAERARAELARLGYGCPPPTISPPPRSASPGSLPRAYRTVRSPRPHS